MAGRKQRVRHPARAGLRSQAGYSQSQAAAATAETDVDWETSATEGEDDGEKPGVSGSTGGSIDLGGMLRNFLDAQQRREQSLVRELRSLRVSLQTPVASQPLSPAMPTVPVTSTPSTETDGSMLGLPTPATRRQQPDAVTLPAVAGPAAVSAQPQPAIYTPQPKIPTYQADEDIENYLLRFERIARTWKWPEAEWACRLVPLLSGKALDAYTTMDEERSHLYRDLKTALLAKFDISPETYRQRFRQTMVQPGETPTETYHRLKGLYRRWIQPEHHTKEQIGETVILEQLLRVLPTDVRTWVKEHDPADGLQASTLAQQYINARRGESYTTPMRSARLAHRTADFWDPAQQPPRRWNDRGATGQRSGTASTTTEPPAPGKTIICYYCQQYGHKASVCPLRKTKVAGACYVPRNEVEPAENIENSHKTYKTVVVKGQKVLALIDSGSFMSLINRRLSSISTLDYGNTTDIVCVHGDRHAYPRTEITVLIEDQPYLLTVGVVENLPVDLLLGRDLPVLLHLLRDVDEVGHCHTINVTSEIAKISHAKTVMIPTEGEDNSIKVNVNSANLMTQKANEVHTTKVDTGKNDGVVCPVFTRAQARAGVQPLPDLDPSLCEGGTKGPKKSRRQRRFERHLGITGKRVSGLTTDKMWTVPDNINELQRNDVTLKPLWGRVRNVGMSSHGGKDCFVVDKGLLYMQTDTLNRLVIPVACRQVVMYLAHTVPWAGHLGRHKTYMRVSSRFFWPGMYTDIQQYCMTCPICQKTCIPRRSERARLHPLPVISTPFRRIAMDIVGPLAKSSQGHQYILVVCDYATRYPEAFPLRTITTSAVMHALVELFSRVGIPDEILTDQGTNFTSRLMQQFHTQLGITALKTTPYHPQTDGLVERFNQTLKRMLQKFVADTGKDWHRWLPFLLFAYREVPQASTGFSPFELLYGWDVQGPLDLLHKGWEGPEHQTEEKGVVQFILEMRERLAGYQDEAERNMLDAQQSQKTWYDQKARQRELQPGQKVLLLLPSSTSKLLAKWQGPYVVTRRMGPVTYEVHHPDKKKADLPR